MVKRNLQQGVTLIELIVVVAIFAIVASVLLFNFSDFSTNVSVRNLSQDIALSIRKAQSYATSVRFINATSNSDAFPAYGISFSLSDPDLVDLYPDQKQFVVFADVGTSDKIYNQNDNICNNQIDNKNECIEIFTINSADKIADILVDGNSIKGETLNIIFKRPSPDALFCVDEGGGCVAKTFSSVEIIVRSAKGLERTIRVWNTGQISVT